MNTALTGTQRARMTPAQVQAMIVKERQDAAMNAALTETPTGQQITAEAEAMTVKKRKDAIAKITAAQATRDAALEGLLKQHATAEKNFKKAKAGMAAVTAKVQTVRNSISNVQAVCERACSGLRQELAAMSPLEIDAFTRELSDQGNDLRRIDPRSKSEGDAARAKLNALRAAGEKAEALRLTHVEPAAGVAGVVELRQEVQAAYADAEKKRAADAPQEAEEAERAHNIEVALGSRW